MFFKIFNTVPNVIYHLQIIIYINAFIKFYKNYNTYDTDKLEIEKFLKTFPYIILVVIYIQLHLAFHI